MNEKKWPTIKQLWQNRVTQTPNSVFLAENGKHYTYSEIDQKVNQKVKELLFDVQEIMLKGNMKPFQKIVKDIPQHMKNDVIAALLAMCYSQRVGYDYQSLNEMNKEEQRIFMTVGSMDKVNVKDIIDFFVRYADIPKREIGDITIKRKFTFVNLSPGAAQKVLDYCYNQKIKGRRVRIELAQDE